jgi:hypothetical protein
MPTKTSATATSNVPVVSHSIETEMEELRQQVQLLKKQTVTALDQAKKFAEREQGLPFFRHKNLLSWKKLLLRRPLVLWKARIICSTL